MVRALDAKDPRLIKRAIALGKQPRTRLGWRLRA
jgi:hypothetical protein